MTSVVELIQHSKNQLPVISMYWEGNNISQSSGKDKLCTHYNTTMFRGHASHKVISTSINLSELLRK